MAVGAIDAVAVTVTVAEAVRVVRAVRVPGEAELSPGVEALVGALLGWIRDVLADVASPWAAADGTPVGDPLDNGLPEPTEVTTDGAEPPSP